jgi:hypothetical protein
LGAYNAPKRRKFREPLNKLAFECSMGLSGDFEGMDGQLSD